jgi:hypothetical protein
VISPRVTDSLKGHIPLETQYLHFYVYLKRYLCLKLKLIESRPEALLHSLLIFLLKQDIKEATIVNIDTLLASGRPRLAVAFKSNYTLL